MHSQISLFSLQITSYLQQHEADFFSTKQNNYGACLQWFELTAKTHACANQATWTPEEARIDQRQCQTSLRYRSSSGAYTHIAQPSVSSLSKLVM